MTDEEIKNLILQYKGDEGFNCAAAFSLSSKHDVPLKKIYDLCNELKVRIKNCQLGCFQ